MTIRHLITGAFLTTAFSALAFAQGGDASLNAAQRKKLTEMHTKMAEMHSKMADCLTSDKTPAECRQQMIDQCSASFGGTCPMGMGMQGGPGMMRGRGNGMMMGNGSCLDWMVNPVPDAENAK